MALEHLKAKKKDVAGKWAKGQGPPTPKAPAPKFTGKEKRIGRADYRQLCQGSRLPPGSRKQLTWDGELWTVIMTVPTFPEPFTGQGRSELEALHLTHSKYQATAERISKGLDI
jgi:hypothetical protein